MKQKVEMQHSAQVNKQLTLAMGYANDPIKLIDIPKRGLHSDITWNITLVIHF